MPTCPTGSTNVTLYALNAQQQPEKWPACFDAATSTVKTQDFAIVCATWQNVPRHRTPALPYIVDAQGNVKMGAMLCSGGPAYGSTTSSGTGALIASTAPPPAPSACEQECKKTYWVSIAILVGLVILLLLAFLRMGNAEFFK